MREEYDDERFCTHCGESTPHVCFDSGHERDSSWDWQECKVCRWKCTGISGEYRPPFGGKASE